MRTAYKPRHLHVLSLDLELVVTLDLARVHDEYEAT